MQPYVQIINNDHNKNNKGNKNNKNNKNISDTNINENINGNEDDTAGNGKENEKGEMILMVMKNGRNFKKWEMREEG